MFKLNFMINENELYPICIRIEEKMMVKFIFKLKYYMPNLHQKGSCANDRASPRRGDPTWRRFGFVRRAQAAPSVEGVGWVRRTSYWASPDETALLAPRLGVIFRLARPIRLLAALLASRLEMLLSQRNNPICYSCPDKS